MFAWPMSIRQQWPEQLSYEARINVLVAIGSVLSSRDKEWWVGKRDWAVFFLDQVMTGDEDESVRNGAALLLGPLLESFQAYPTRNLNLTGEPVPLKDFVERHGAYEVTPRWDHDVREAADRLRSRWSNQVQG